MASSSRMLTMLSLLQARRDWPGALLAERLDISDRTVRRDVERLRELGYRIRAIKGPDGGYRLDAGSELPPLLFDDDQAVVLALALQTASLAGTGLEDAAARALIGVRQVMPSRLRHRVDAVSVTAIETPGRNAERPIAAGVFVALGAAVRDASTVRFDYASVPSPTTSPSTDAHPAPREVEPRGLVSRSGRWYLVAWAPDRDDWRTYRLDRITLRQYSGRRFHRREVPGGDLAGFVAGRFRGSTNGTSWPCNGSVVLAADAAQFAPYLLEGTIEDLGPGRCRVTAGAWSWAGLAATLGRLDADFVDVEPLELRNAFAMLSERFASATHSGATP